MFLSLGVLLLIVEHLLNSLALLIAGTINFLPEFTAINWLSGNLQFAQWCAWANYYLPMGDFVACLGAILTCWVVSALVRVVIDII